MTKLTVAFCNSAKAPKKTPVTYYHGADYLIKFTLITTDFTADT
jgi:hypothetical protein